MQALMPVVNEIRDELASLKRDSASLKECLNETISQLEEHKDRTTSELADLQTSPQSSIDNPPTEMISDAVLQKILPYLNDIEENLFTDLSSLINHKATSTDGSLSSLSGDLEMYKNWTMSELADLQISLQSSVRTTHSTTEQLTQLSAKMDATDSDLSSLINDRATSIGESVNSLSGDQEMYKNWTMSELAHLQTSLQSISDTVTTIDVSVSSFSRDLEEHKNRITSELADLQTFLQSSINTTHNEQLTQLSGKMDAQHVSLNSHMSHEISSLESRIDAMINPLNSQLASVSATSTLMRDDLNCVRTDLNSLNDSMNRVCDKVEEHEDHMTAELMELNEYLKENLTYQISSNDNLEEYTCGGTGGWRRVVYLNMTDNNTECPSGWRETGYSKRTCGRATDGYNTCDSVTFPVSGGEYSQVCGRIKAYQWGVTGGFYGYSLGYNTTDDAYFSGVSVMHGSPRQHIWTFAAGSWENRTGYWPDQCPCDSTLSYIHIPPFVGEDYFCESGYIWPGYLDTESLYTLHSNDTLWDGRDCHSSSICCSLHNHPFFTKTLSTPTKDDLELRRCGLYGHYENVAIESIELYVKEGQIESQLLELDQHMKQSFTHQINNINNLGVHTCGGTGGWRRAVYLDMTDPNTDCPSGWNETGYSKRTCGRARDDPHTCDSVTFPVSGGEYSQVCGRIRAYQKGLTSGFYGYSHGYNTTDDAYFTGVAVMHGSPRQHIWTFAAGAWENGTWHRVCPCDSGYGISIPPFVGEDYFCESGYIYPGYGGAKLFYILHSNDTLWDGRDCYSTSTCCSLHNPPYFTKPLKTSTTDDIELRMCHYFDHRYENVAVELVEMYVK